MKSALVCVGDAGINGLATVRALGRRGIPVDVVALESSAQIASASRYCRRFFPARDLAGVIEVLRGLEPGAVLYVDNDPMLKALAPHAAELAQRFALADPLAQALQLTDKAWQMQVARKAGIAVPKSWYPAGWEELSALRTSKRLIAKPIARAEFKALIAADAAALAAALRSRGVTPAEVVVQEFVEGGDDQIYAGLCYRARSRDRCFVLSARKLRQTEPGAGVMAVGQAVDAPQVREMTRRLAKAAGAYGALSTEFKLDARDGRWYFIEWNPRPAYFQSIGWKAGFDLAWLAWCDHADPQQLEALPRSFSGDHYWINVHGDLLNFARLPVRDATAWLPYLRRKQWAVFALDDAAPWRKSVRHLAGWLFRGRSFGRALGRLAARRA